MLISTYLLNAELTAVRDICSGKRSLIAHKHKAVDDYEPNRSQLTQHGCSRWVTSDDGYVHRLMIVYAFEAALEGSAICPYICESSFVLATRPALCR